MTHPDITYAVSVVNRYMHAPRQPNFNAVRRILCYLKRAPRWGLLYKPSPSLSVTGFSDTNWVGSRFEWQSTSGYGHCTFVGDNQAAIYIASNLCSKNVPNILSLNVTSFGI